jgi:sterol desaturase/sphingolipid hydroxylase (fatty acid hydroxylase superfamily)
MDWLVTHSDSLQTYTLAGALAAAALWESFRSRRPLAHPLRERWICNVGLLVLGGLLTRLVVPMTVAAVALSAHEHGFGLLNVLAVPLPLAIVATVLVLDASAYAQHWLFHHVGFLWRFHQIHHSDLDVDCGTAVRHHPGEALLVGWVDLVIVAVLGAPAEGVVIFAVLAGVVSAVNHANVPSGGRIERVLRLFVVTPDMHRVHHSAVFAESNRNLTAVFPWWDHLFGTYLAEPAGGHEHMHLGLAEYRDTADVALVPSLFMPFRSARMGLQSPA